MYKNDHRQNCPTANGFLSENTHKKCRGEASADRETSTVRLWTPERERKTSKENGIRDEEEGDGVMRRERVKVDQDADEMID